MAKGRVRQILLTVFRVIQFILSLVALVCGIYSELECASGQTVSNIA